MRRTKQGSPSKLNMITAMQGMAALQEAVGRIGDDDFNDHKLAEIIVENELPIRHVIWFLANEIADKV